MYWEWLVSCLNRTAPEKKSFVHLHYTSVIVWSLLRSFSTCVGSYTERTSMCLKWTPIFLDIRSSNSQTKHQEMALTADVEESATPEELSLASSRHPSAFRFNSSPLKPQDNSFFRSTEHIKVWKCSHGHVSQLLFPAGARRHLPSKGRLYENPLLSALAVFLSTSLSCWP